ncbi:SDR family NAD(P)-dependent oxidoreductase [Sorangium sp. So ce321]
MFETNVFGVVAVNQAMLPLLREAPAARIVNVSSGAGSLTMNSDRTFPWRSIFGPVYPASKTALNAMTLTMAIRGPRRSWPTPKGSRRTGRATPATSSAALPGWRSAPP